MKIVIEINDSMLSVLQNIASLQNKSLDDVVLRALEIRCSAHSFVCDTLVPALKDIEKEFDMSLSEEKK